jgi:hypothetical protein
VRIRIRKDEQSLEEIFKAFLQHEKKVESENKRSGFADKSNDEEDGLTISIWKVIRTKMASDGARAVESSDEVAGEGGTRADAI